MPNIFDYLEWRGDLSFKADPFNDVDNLILAELAYTEFDGIVPEDGTMVSLETARDGYFATHSKVEAMMSDNHVVRAPLLMDGMVIGDRFRETMLSDYIDIIDADRDLQISAVTFNLGDGSRYISFRGTDNTVVGWKEDFNMSYLPETGGQRKAIEYLNRVGSREKGRLFVGGHSKGGNFAVYAAAFADPEVQRKIKRVYTNDGPGFRTEVMESRGYKKILPKVTSIVPDTSIIGMLLTSQVRHTVVRSSERGFAQHDALTWQVKGNEFVLAEPSDLGMFIRETQKDWLSKLDDNTRQLFVDTLFSLLEATGHETFGEMKERKLKSIERIISTAQDLSRDKQRELARIVKEFLQSGGQNMKEWYDRRH